MDGECNDPDLNFLMINLKLLICLITLLMNFDSVLKNLFYILQMNIRSMNKNLEKLQEYLNVFKHALA